MSLSNKDDIQVSVCVVTYNQENYIAECLESLVTQQTSFKFEIIVGEDCSTDGTRAIVQHYVEQYPNLVIPLFHESNVGAVENVKRAYKAARGKYIAHMDGDDYALPYKLQKQFDVLENNLNCNVCTHNMLCVESNGNTNASTNWVYSKGIYDIFDLYHKLPFFAHSSKMFRNKYSPHFWDNLLNSPIVLDIDIHIENTIDGNIFHLDDFLGCYRIDVGISFNSGKVNSALPLGAERVFKKGLSLFENDFEKYNKIEKLYSIAMMQCAYNYAVFDNDVRMFNEYLNKSKKIASLGKIHILLDFANKYPKIFFKLFRLRHQMRKRGIWRK
ncbi:glycosyltransferase family 2 protein [Acinetobacter radioresistens]|uniref:glycosyltransferase family 2 protein n=1 Tax=Acinetobacter radioresistens TaxID=40216 RepID=UPI0035CD3A3E